jgi:hypothetical protein
MDSQVNITFGVEIEFVFAMRYKLLVSWAESQGHPEDLMEMLDRNISGLVRLFVRQLLTHTIPGQVSTPSILGDVSLSNPGSADYRNWTLTSDASVGCFFREVTDAMGIDPNSEPDEWQWLGMELVSCVLNTTDIDQWLPMLQQIHQDLAPTAHMHGAFSNKYTDAGLHVHVALEPPGFDAYNPTQDIGELSLSVVKTVLILWAVYEEQIEAFHPYHRRDNNHQCYYAASLRNRYDPRSDFTPADFASAVYGANSFPELVTQVYGRNRNAAKHSKIGLNWPRHNKKLTLEFREHRGTIDPEEIFWWVRFIEGFMRVAKVLADMKFELTDTTVLVREYPLLELINLPDMGKRYFTDKARQYAAELEEDDRDTDSSSEGSREEDNHHDMDDYEEDEEAEL